MRKTVLLLAVFCFFACKSERVSLKFLNEFVVKDSLRFKNTIVGGISGIDFVNNQYYMVVDDAVNPRVLVGTVLVENDLIKSVGFKKVIQLDSTSRFYKNTTLDLESVFVDSHQINLVSEGSINKGKNPAVFKIDSLGKFIENTTFPMYFNARAKSKPKHNGVFESSSKSYDKKGFWVAMEAPLGADGEEPTFHKTHSPIRITYFNKKGNVATKQFAYQLEKIDKPAKGKVNLNGVTAILEYAENSFFIVERAYQNGYGAFGNTVRIFKATINKKTTNILALQSLKDEIYISLKKELLFDFEDVKELLTDKIIDNIEGITFGPILSNGNRSLILVSDDNFQIYGKQLNQFLLLEFEEK